MGELRLFASRLLSSPGQVSAAAPSSRHLARAMAEGIGPDTGRVVEFGPGTGALTRGLLDAGLPPQNLTLLELDGNFAAHLAARFPGVAVHHLGADQADTVVSPGVEAVISGLPLLSMPPALREAIVGAAFRILAPGAPYVQFTYGPRSPLPDDSLARLGLRVEPGCKVWINLPPARVYRFYRA